MREGVSQPGHGFLTATEKVWRVGWGRKIYSFVAGTMCHLFFEIYKKMSLAYK